MCTLLLAERFFLKQLLNILLARDPKVLCRRELRSRVRSANVERRLRSSNISVATSPFRTVRRRSGAVKRFRSFGWRTVEYVNLKRKTSGVPIRRLNIGIELICILVLRNAYGSNSLSMAVKPPSERATMKEMTIMQNIT